MFKNILIISLCCWLLAIAEAEHKPQVLTRVVDEFSDELYSSPFKRVGNKLYLFGETKVSWFKAFLICRSEGGYLASFNSQQELSELSNYTIANYPNRWWWISASSLDAKGDYYWYNTGERIAYADWSDGQPDNAGGNENCIHLWLKKSKYQMNDWRCDQKAHYICEADKPKTVMVSVL